MPSAPDAAPRFALRTVEPTGFGTGWLSGVLSAALGLFGLGAVLCFHFPSLLTMPEARALYPLLYVRALLHVVLVVAFTLGALSLSLRRNKALGTVGVTATLVAALLGGSRVPIEGELQSGPFLGLDWFLLNLVLYSVVFIPLERLFARLPEQGVFRRGWRTDLTYFFVSTFLVQLTTILTLKPAMIFFDWAVVPAAQVWIRSLPGVIQFAALLIVADFTQYWVHRTFHRVPALWRFHAVHHSATEMDWLAGSRLHLVDIAVTRGLTYVPIYLLGFAEGPLLAYLVVVSAQATFIHANVRFEFGWLRWLLATPQFHHWHHAAEPQAVDKNFAVHVPVLDVIFRTAYLPARWPSAYGLTSGGVTATRLPTPVLLAVPVPRAGYTPLMPLASWLFIKDGQSIWIERPHAFSMIVAGPGSAREHHDFPDETSLEKFQISIGERLTEAGWFLWGFDRERRNGRERRNIDRKTPDRRRVVSAAMR